MSGAVARAAMVTGFVPVPASETGKKVMESLTFGRGTVISLRHWAGRRFCMPGYDLQLLAKVIAIVSVCRGSTMKGKAGQ